MIPPEARRHLCHWPRDALGEELLQLLPGSCEIRRAMPERGVEDGEAVAEQHEQARDESGA